MINRLYTRPSRAVEKLQQLNLNNGAGIDCTRPHSDTKSVYASKNLVVNTDGSLSLRKPLILRTKFNTNITRVIPLPDNAFIAVGTFDKVKGFLILDSTLKSTKFRVIWHDVYGNERVNEVPNDTPIPSSLLDVSECYAADTASGVILSNCALSRTAEKFPGKGKDSLGDTYHPVFDTALYDDNDDIDETSPRLVNVFYDSSLYAWCVKVHIPVPTNYLTTDSGVEVSRDMLLDNPFATRDAYNVAVPSVKTIRAYAYTAKEAEGIVLADSDVSLTATEVCDTVTQSCSGVYSEFDNSIDSTAHLRTFIYDDDSKYRTIAKFGNVELKFKLNIKSEYKLRQILNQSSAMFGNVVINAQDVKISGSLIAEKLSEYVDVTTLSDFQIKIPANTWKFSAVHEFFNMSHGAGFNITLGTFTGAQNTSETTITANTFSVSNSVVLMNFEFAVSGNLFSKNPEQVDAIALFDSTSNLYTNVYTSGKTFATMQYSYRVPDVPTDVRVVDLTESVKNVRYRAMDFVDFDKLKQVVLKAFLSIPTAQFDDIYCSWRYTLDGITWQDALAGSDGISVTEPSQEPLKDVSAPKSEISDTFTYKKLLSTGEFSNENLVSNRADCLTLVRRTDALDGRVWDAVAFKFKLVTLEGIEKDPHVKATYGETLFYETVGSTISFEESDIGNAASGKQLYSNSRLYSFGDTSLKNNILYSYANEFETPLTNIISLAASSDNEVTTIVRWRNSLISATEHALYLSEQQGESFYTKTLNTAVGIPKSDGDCCVPVLNGVIFKSGNKVYQLYPNVYSDNDTTLNVTDISQSISHYLEEWSTGSSRPSFAFSTESEYVLMLPQQSRTCCLRYDYNSRVWTAHVYGVELQAVKILDLDDIRLWGVSPDGSAICEYMFDASFAKLPFSKDHSEHLDTLPYGDVLTRNASPVTGSQGTLVGATVSEIVEYMHSGTTPNCISPIEFELDTGQKTDTVLTTKQFVESKLVFATLNKNDAFPMQLTVHVDGDPHLVTRDISTDAPFWKDSSTSGVLNTTFGGLSSTSDSFNTLRQLVVRYSGKGKSVRHILTGESLCNFKLYETYIRYKLLNVKQ